MLHEAVYRRSILHNDTPPFDAGLAAPGVCSALNDWGNRSGVTALICVRDTVPVGAAWHRFYAETNAIRGYVDEETPVVMIAVARPDSCRSWRRRPESLISRFLALDRDHLERAVVMLPPCSQRSAPERRRSSSSIS